MAGSLSDYPALLCILIVKHRPVKTILTALVLVCFLLLLRLANSLSQLYEIPGTPR